MTGTECCLTQFFCHTLTTPHRPRLQKLGNLSLLLLRVKLDPPFPLKLPVVKTTILWNTTQTATGCQSTQHTAWLLLKAHTLYSEVRRRIKLSVHRLTDYFLSGSTCVSGHICQHSWVPTHLNKTP